MLSSRLFYRLLVWVCLPACAACAQSASQATGGWQGLARVLDALTPGVDTRIAPTAAQVAQRIGMLLARDMPQEALQLLQAWQAQQTPSTAPGDDVQLLFLRARALNALQRYEEAAAIYHDMTQRYPELPEPWNNLAAEYMRQGQPERAQQALQMALAANPGYVTARTNLAVVERALNR